MRRSSRLLPGLLAGLLAGGCILPEYEKDPAALSGSGGSSQAGGAGGRGGAGGAAQSAGGAGGAAQAGGSGGRGGAGGAAQAGGSGGRGGAGGAAQTGGAGGAAQTGGAGGAGPVDAGPPAPDGPSADAGGTSTPKDAGGDPCTPACIATLLAPCPSVGACMTETPTATTSNTCYANGVKILAEVMPSSAGISGLFRVRRPDGALCYTVEFEGDDDLSVAVYKNASGGVVATMVSDADDDTVVSCEGKEHVLPAHCAEEDPNEPTCTPGVCR